MDKILFSGGKKIIFVFTFVFISIITIALIILLAIHINKNQNISDNKQECVFGIHTRFSSGSCICDEPTKFFGKYCNEKPIKSCKTNNDCPSKYFCLVVNNEGKCYKASYSSLKKNKTFALSESIMSQDNASSFCSAIGSKYRPVRRKDFNCDRIDGGVACLDKKLVIKLRDKLHDKFGLAGFFWLEEIKNSNSAYYADFEDGIVYNISKYDFWTNKVLCIKEK